MKKILITGSAGFIGSALALRFLELGENVVGIDNMNSYYDVNLKKGRLERCLGFESYIHYSCDISAGKELTQIFEGERPEIVINLAAQAGVRYSIQKPEAYAESNLMGFTNILENCRHYGVEHLVYASSSSVYGGNSKLPFSEDDRVDTPLSFYAATKRANEVMAHSYSHLFGLVTTGLRFFTVYGPWGRPDMALFKFTDAILRNESIELYNYGEHTRDFTYIDDIVDGLVRVSTGYPKSKGTDNQLYNLYNIGNGTAVHLKKYVEAIEEALGKKAKIKLLPLQSGDVADTHSDISRMSNDFGYSAKVGVRQGINQFIEWYLTYYKERK